MIRSAQLSDLDDLCQLEMRCFSSDALSKRSFRHLLLHGNAKLWIDERANQLAGYALVLFRKRSHVARIYSLAVAPEYRGQGVAVVLMQQCEHDAQHTSHVKVMRLEVQAENYQAMHLYQGLGYQPIADLPDYYADHSAGIRMQKDLNLMV